MYYIVSIFKPTNYFKLNSLLEFEKVTIFLINFYVMDNGIFLIIALMFRLLFL